MAFIAIFFADILTKLFHKSSLSSPQSDILSLSKLLKLIGCHGSQKTELGKIFKNHLFRSYKEHELEELCIYTEKS